MLEISWIDLAAIGTLLVISTGLVVTAMKSKFLTYEKHEEICGGINKPVEKGLDEIRRQIREIEHKRNEAMKERNRQNLWLVQALRRIADKVGADIHDMPS